MLRGVSLAPQQRVAKDTQELPTELVNSIIGVSAHAPPDYGATGSTGGASLLSTAAPQTGASSGGAPSLLTRLFRSARRRCETNMPSQVPVFDANGNLTTSQTGVNTFRFRSLSLFYFFRAQPWTALITYSVLLYLAIVLLISAAYYVWGVYCGAGLNVVVSIYFTVVSLAANGGYLGEDEGTMTDSTHMCYRGRTMIVMVCSYVNIVFVGLVAALVVGKAEYTGKLGHRVVFSDFCTLSSIPGRVGQYRLTFRMANVDNNIPLAHGKLRVFCVTSEPLQEYRRRQKQLYLLKNSAPTKAMSTTPSSLRGSPQPQALTEAVLEDRSAALQRHQHKRHHHSSNTPAPAAAAAAAARPLSTRRNIQAALAPLRSSSALATDQQETRPPPPRRRCGRGRSVPPADAASGPEAVDDEKKKEVKEAGDDVQRSAGTSSGGSSASSSRTSSRSRSSSASASRSSSTSSHASAVQEPTTAKLDSRAAARGAAAAVASDVTNSSVTSKQNSALYAASPLTAAAGSFSGPGFHKQAVAAAAAVLQVPDEDSGNGDRGMERVHLRVQEMRWTCAEESYVDHGDSGQLSLWYPVNITHTIDERSPLYSFMQLPFVAASLKEGPSMVFGSARSDDSSVHPPSLGAAAANNDKSRLDAAHHRFQLVAVFDATEMESGSTITAKHTYTTVDIVAHYRFSERLVHMQPSSGEVMLDFHYFNALLPADLIELSTTDSDL
ncbi:hypothetical protein ABB37_06917 [Leptomonas pyrrhocoris]|uniref:Uncharacterized protein n=1 Tax=Leptomonas pyrrhocoris TaxID=157538 RepID=A0A0N0DTI7_LEPPY|nr:hypothetical protein ABB37_06917 [Leptomonas pyrrhocoris]KPA77538.1 hypothetical protein ABB37_06917 [Leptomonas pyrrhocoris]|eukprot:XP_015655977.1 hypothetical protein ABB37_06917 [Leptomonas pyrrhocoris]